MFRFIAPVIVLTVIFWLVLYVIAHPEKRKGLLAFRQIGIALLLALGSLALVSIVVYFVGEF